MADDMLGSASVPIRATLGQLSKDLESARRKISEAVDGAASAASKTLSEKLGEIGSKLSSAGKKLSLGVTLPVVAAGGSALKLAADFDTTMRQVAAATDAPADQIQSLRDLALQYGADTKFSAQEAGEAMLELAKSGMSKAQIEGGALAATLNVAATEGLSMGDSATYIVNALGAFGLKASDASSVATALAGASVASTASVSSLGQALGQVGPGAKNAGLSLQETTGILAAFDQQGIKGSDAGTSLKTMLMRLVPQTDKAASAMQDLGLNFVDAQGNFLPIADVAQQLQDKLGGLSQAQQAAALTTIFGSDATRAATVLMGLGEKGVEQYTKAAEDQSAVQKLVSATTDGTAGALEQASGSIETAAISFGTALAPAVVAVANKIQDLANWFANLSPETQKTILVIVGLVAAIGPLLMILGSIANGIKAVSAALSFLAANPIVLIIAAVAALVAGFIYLWNTSEGFRDFFIGIWEAIKSAVEAVISFFTDTVWPGLTSAWDAIMAALQAVGDFFADVWSTITDIFQTVLDFLVAVFVTSWQKTWDTVTKIVTGAYEGIKKGLSAAWDFIKGAAEVAWLAIKTVIVNPIEAVVKGVTTAAQAIGKALSAAWDGIKSAAQGAWNLIYDYIVKPIKAAYDWIVGTFKSIGDTIGGAFTTVMDWIKTPINKIITGINWVIRQLNKLSFTIPSWVPGIGGSHWGINIGEIPYLATGTPFFGGGLAIAGEHGKELLNLPRGTRVTPAAKTESLLSGAANSEPRMITIVQELNGREISRVVAPLIADEIRVHAGARR